jgi:hypothetical protein
MGDISVVELRYFVTQNWEGDMAKKEPRNLVKIIKSELAAGNRLRAEIDNDCWTLHRDVPQPKDFDKWNYEEQDSWRDNNQVICSEDKFDAPGDGGYGSGNCYGGDLLQAFAQIIGSIKVESV